MIKSFLVSMFAIFLFTLGAAGAWFYIQMSPEGDAAAEESLDLTGQLAEKPSPIPQGMADSDTGQLPAVIRGPDFDADDLVRMKLATSAREEQLRKQEETLREIRLRIQTADADNEAAQREIDGVLAQSRSILDNAERLLGELQSAMDSLKQQAADLDKRKQEMSQLEDSLGEGTAAKIKEFSEYLKGMPPEVAAKVVKAMVEDDRMDYVVRLFKEMEGRNVAKILAELGDEGLVAEIAERYAGEERYR